MTCQAQEAILSRTKGRHSRPAAEVAPGAHGRGAEAVEREREAAGHHGRRRSAEEGDREREARDARPERDARDRRVRGSGQKQEAARVRGTNQGEAEGRACRGV